MPSLFPDGDTLTPPIVYRIALSLIAPLKLEKARRLMELVGSPADFFTARPEYLRSRARLSPAIAADDYRRDLLARARKELIFMQAHGIKAVHYTDPLYPPRLLECPDAPQMLYLLGNPQALTAPCALAVVGTRHATTYGLDFTRDVVEALAAGTDDKPLIISGLAFGIDIAAHRAALAAGAPTVAVLAHGLKQVYPSAHRGDAARILQAGGALVTEYTSDVGPQRPQFLARNRIIAGLADAVLVAESPQRSGALSTARAAAEYSRDVMALPGRISDPYSAGCNDLIRRNVASLVTSPTDVADILGRPLTPAPDDTDTLADLIASLSPEAREVLAFLRDNGDSDLNRLILALGIPVHLLNSALVDLEFNKLIRCSPGNRYSLA